MPCAHDDATPCHRGRSARALDADNGRGLCAPIRTHLQTSHATSCYGDRMRRSTDRPKGSFSVANLLRLPAVLACRRADRRAEPPCHGHVAEQSARTVRTDTGSSTESANSSLPKTTGRRRSPTAHAIPWHTGQTTGSTASGRPTQFLQHNPLRRNSSRQCCAIPRASCRETFSRHVRRVGCSPHLSTLPPFALCSLPCSTLWRPTWPELQSRRHRSRLCKVLFPDAGGLFEGTYKGAALTRVEKRKGRRSKGRPALGGTERRLLSARRTTQSPQSAEMSPHGREIDVCVSQCSHELSKVPASSYSRFHPPVPRATTRDGLERPRAHPGAHQKPHRSHLPPPRPSRSLHADLPKTRCDGPASLKEEKRVLKRSLLPSFPPLRFPLPLVSPSLLPFSRSSPGRWSAQIQNCRRGDSSTDESRSREEREREAARRARGKRRGARAGKGETRRARDKGCGGVGYWRERGRGGEPKREMRRQESAGPG